MYIHKYAYIYIYILYITLYIILCNIYIYTLLIKNCGYDTENISSFLDYDLEPLAQTVKSYIKDTNHFLSKLKIFGKLPQGGILCIFEEVAGPYPNIPYSLK